MNRKCLILYMLYTHYWDYFTADLLFVVNNSTNVIRIIDDDDYEEQQNGANKPQQRKNLFIKFLDKSKSSSSMYQVHHKKTLVAPLLND